jgi:hypothetical protein
MGLGWFETKPKLEDEGSGKGVLRVGVGCLKAVYNLLFLPNWWWRVACVGLFASRATWGGSVSFCQQIKVGNLRTGKHPPPLTSLKLTIPTSSHDILDHSKPVLDDANA